MRIQLGESVTLGALFLTSGAAPASGLSTSLVIRRAVSGVTAYWTGSGYTGTRTVLSGTEVSGAGDPGEYQYVFTPTSGGTHFFTFYATSSGSGPYPSGVAGPVQPGEVQVGGWVDNVDDVISDKALASVTNAGFTSVLNNANANATALLAATNGVPSGVWARAISGHEATSGSAGALLGALGDVVLGNTVIDRTDPTHWMEKQYKRTDSGTAVLVYGLYGMDGSKVSDSNNPFSDPANRNAGILRRLLVSGTL